MRYRLIAKTEGGIYLTETTVVERDGVLFEFMVDETGLLCEVAVSMQVSADRIRDVSIQFGEKKPGEAPPIVSGSDNSVFERLVHELQALESGMSFTSEGSLKRIAWDNPQSEFIAESPEEESLIDITSFSVQRGLKPIIVRFKPEDIERFVKTNDRYEELIIQQAFLREAWNAYATQQYIQSFYNSFFIIEDFYAKGKSREVEFMKQLERSAEFKEVATQALMLFQSEQPKEFEKVKVLFEEVDCEATPDDLPRALFRQRGSLHHYYGRSPKHRGTPFNQREYKELAFFTSFLSYRAILYRIVAINQSLADE